MLPAFSFLIPGQNPWFALLKFSAAKLTLSPLNGLIDLLISSSHQPGFPALAVSSTSAGSFDERLSFGDEFRRENQCTGGEILAVRGDHGLRDLGELNEESVFRPGFLAHVRLRRRRLWLFL
ncbi:hypothetical protein ACVIGB_008984 [Bradyrhizobium sp. USDA 4341]